MKTFAAGLAAHYALQNTTLALFLEVERRDGVFMRFTSLDVDVVVAGDTYQSAQGLGTSKLEVSGGLAVDRLELTVFPDDDIPEIDILAGLLDFARYRIFEANWADPAGGVNVMRRGWLGEQSATRGGYTFELRSLKQSLQQAVGAVVSKTCRYRLGDEGCTVDLGPLTRDLVVTHVGSRYEFTCAAATEADDWYAEGTATALDGANRPAGATVGYAQKVKTFTGGIFHLALPMPFDLQIGDTVRVSAGCRKRLEEDCRDKFANVLNFGGEPHVPGVDALMADPEVSSS